MWRLFELHSNRHEETVSLVDWESCAVTVSQRSSFLSESSRCVFASQPPERSLDEKMRFPCFQYLFLDNNVEYVSNKHSPNILILHVVRLEGSFGNAHASRNPVWISHSKLVAVQLRALRSHILNISRLEENRATVSLLVVKFKSPTHYKNSSQDSWGQCRRYLQLIVEMKLHLCNHWCRATGSDNTNLQTTCWNCSCKKLPHCKNSGFHPQSWMGFFVATSKTSNTLFTHISVIITSEDRTQRKGNMLMRMVI